MQHTMKIFIVWHELHLVLLAVYPACAAAVVYLHGHCYHSYPLYATCCPWLCTLGTFDFFFVLKAPSLSNCVASQQFYNRTYIHLSFCDFHLCCGLKVVNQELPTSPFIALQHIRPYLFNCVGDTCKYVLTRTS